MNQEIQVDAMKVAEDRAEQINMLRGMVKLFPINLAYCLDEGPDTIYFNHRPRVSYPRGFDFSTDASRITYAGCTVTFTCMQLAFYLGFQEIYLIGVDASYSNPKTWKPMIVTEYPYSICPKMIRITFILIILGRATGGMIHRSTR